jgi:hypothetical protein
VFRILFFAVVWEIGTPFYIPLDRPAESWIAANRTQIDEMVEQRQPLVDS